MSNECDNVENVRRFAYERRKYGEPGLGAEWIAEEHRPEIPVEDSVLSACG